MINHRERNQINVHPPASPGGAQRTIRNAFSIYQNQSFLGQNTTQVELNAAVPAIADVQVDVAACFLRQKILKVLCSLDAQFVQVLRPVRVYRIRPGLFRCRNV